MIELIKKLKPKVVVNGMAQFESMDLEFDLDIKDDVKEECSKYVRVKHIHMDKDTSGYVCFLFDNVEAASRAQQDMHKRWFAGSQFQPSTCVLDGYNGTVMAYGNTGIGKTYTLGQLGDEDVSSRGIMVHSMEDMLANIFLETDLVSVSYLQVQIKRSIPRREADFSVETDHSSHLETNYKPPMLRKGKLVLVDLAGSEGVNKSKNAGDRI